MKKTSNGQKKEKIFEDIFNGVDIGIIYSNRLGIIENVNEALLKLLNVSSEDIIGKNVLSLSKKFLSSKDLPLVIRTIQQVMSGKNIEPFSINFKEKVLEITVPRESKSSHFTGLIRDISNRKKMERDLVESEAKFRLMADHTIDCIWMLDMQPVFTYINPAIESVFGFTPEEWIGTKLKEHADEKNYALMMREVAKMIELGPDSPGVLFEAYMLHKDGHAFPVEIKAKMQFNAKGQPIAMMGATSDITERKQAEEELRKKDFIIRSASSAIVTADLNGILNYANAAFLEAWGYDGQDEVVGRHFSDFWVVNSRLDEIMGDLLGEKKQWKESVQAKYKDGTPFDVLISAAAVLDDSGIPIGLMSAAIDITDRVKAEKQLEREQNFSDTIVRSMPSLFYVFEKHSGRFVNRNANWVKTTGYSEDELDNMTILDMVADRDLCAQCMQEAYDFGASEMQNHLLAKNGEKIPYYFTGERLEVDNNIFLVGVGMDISDRIKSEEALQRRVELLTNPEGEDENIKFEDLFDLEDIQRIQDGFGKATGVASIITDIHGNPITRPSNFCRFCIDIVRNSEKGLINCMRSDAIIGSLRIEGPKIQPCLSGGLWDAGTSITVGDNHVANWLIGQVRNETQTETDIRAYANEIGVDEEELVKAFYEVPAMPIEQFEQVANLLFTIANQLSASAYQNIQQARFISIYQEQEKEKKRLRNYLSNIIDSMPSILLGVDEKGRITQWNIEAQKKTGLTEADALGRPLAELIPRLAKEMERVSDAISKRIPITDTKRAFKEDGETHYEDMTIYPLIANGVEGAVIRIDDVTETVRIEEMMVQSEKMLSIGGLAAGMAHEINNPLAGIIQTTNVLANRMGAKPNLPANLKAAENAGTDMESIRRYIEARNIPRMIKTINESGQRVSEIVNNMLSFARKSEDKSTSENIGELIDQTLELAATDYNVKMQYDFKLISIIKEFSVNLPKVYCEKGKIQQVLLNIEKRSHGYA
ncbi:MAG: PAS domain S-box protein [Anaerolineaceae bacterium]|nr:PAS domain S-box protein [Anaerolineaceae bacterium]